ncbi:fibronectin type III domain-containing protein [Aliifodinibius sp. S!AR15-10]|uniref:fibronectin type III domain-containing protein n=1 Tax=Aliifodinibius sp. S!AR15-10 TaxID=2950437 RepID=UPI00285ADB9E|nr:fibronectin type III domain-containing protein [Aliifodinibius sp. S!AR15-10]MDR8390926.1 fibronectin type III domain-containing protein [Aliifodinibius sp. S!AR15-10]
MFKSFNSWLLIGMSLFLLNCGGGGPTSLDEDNEDPPPQEEPTEDTTPPSIPSEMSGESGDGQVSLNWGSVGDDDLEGYNLYRAEQNFTDVSSKNPVNSGLLTNVEFVDENLQNGTTYYYRVTAIDDSGNESNPSSQIEITPFSSPPDRP